MGIKLREASDDDLPIIHQLQQICFQPEAKLYDNRNILPLTETLEYLKKIQGIVHFLVAELDNEIIGSLRYIVKGDNCHIARLMVKPEFQGKGVATKILLYLEDIIPNKIYNVFTGYENERSLHLYRKVGYQDKWLEQMDSHFSFVHLQKDSRNIFV